MARLTISLLGPFEVTLDGQRLTGFDSNKVRALLAYLAVEAGRPHRRDSLAALLWPEWPDAAARSNLRHTLFNLRKSIADHQAKPPFLHITRETVQFNTASDHWCDVTAFTDLVATKGSGQGAMEQLEGALAVYGGSFLEGFFLKGCPAFDDWSLLVRERLQRQALAALHRLAGHYEQRGQYQQACDYAQRQLELEPWQEGAHQQLMRLLVLSGRRGAALAQYEACRRLLAEELGVEPGPETIRLYEQIRDGEVAATVPADVGAEPPAFLTEDGPEVERPVFVARERELAQLRGFLQRALARQGGVVFVHGEAGSGKTALLQEFARRALDARADVVVAWGKGNAYTGVGDPYLPFREVLGLLTGDAEAPWAAGAISGSHARRLWSTLPLAAQALVEDGPDLIGPFIAGRALLRRAVAAGGGAWLGQLQELVQGRGFAAAPQQSDLFAQYSRVLQRLAQQAPLLLWLDDLQWADGGSINLLFHLGRQLAGQRILIVGAYRGEEVALGRAGQRHPLEPVVNEFQRQYGDIVVDLSHAEGREFMEAFLDSERNRLGAPFRDMLYRQTGGHALFTVELLRGLQERGDLVQDDLGRWLEGPALGWETLPARVEGVIAERTGRLPQALQEMLQVASVEGEEFSAGLVAEVLGADEGQVVRRLSGVLSKRHRLVAAASLQALGPGRQQYCYRFGHFLFQKYLYGQLDDVQRVHVHRSMANILEAWYWERVAAGDARQFGIGFPPVAEGAVQLARHFEAAGVVEKAAEYRQHAGLRAEMAFAGEEAIKHFELGLALLDRLPDAPERAEQELSLLRSLAHARRYRRAWTDPQVAGVYARMEQLCEEMEEVPLPLLNSILWQLFTFRNNRAEYEKALELGKRILALALRAENPVLIATAHLPLGLVLTRMGQYASAREHLDCMIDFWHRHPQKLQCLLDWMNVAPTLSHQSWVLWFLGFPDQALQRSREAIGVAQELDDTLTLAGSLGTAGAEFHLFRRELPKAQKCVDLWLRLAVERGFSSHLAASYRGYLLAHEGQVEEGIERMRQGLAVIQAWGRLSQRTHRLAMLAEAYGKAGKPDYGLDVLAEALALVEETGERYYEAELHRLKGELLWMQGDEAAAEPSFRYAIEVARRQQAKSWELRATMSLSRLMGKQGKREEARHLLADIYNWFTEGFDTPDLVDAKALLEELS